MDCKWLLKRKNVLKNENDLYSLVKYSLTPTRTIIKQVLHNS